MRTQDKTCPAATLTRCLNQEKPMQHTRTIITALCSLSLFSTATFVQAAEINPQVSDKDRIKHETTGVLGGAVVGGLVGGPVGAIVTAAFGGWVSDKTLAKKENQLLSAALTRQERDMLALQAEYRALQARYETAARDASKARGRNASLQTTPADIETANCCKDSEIALHFKTGSARVETLYDDKLRAFATLANSLPEAVIEITGHADRRGEPAKNLALSQQRIQAVETRLRAMGVRNRALQTSAFGESRPLTAEDSLENNFFDRRVVVKILSPDSDTLAQAND